MMDNSQCSYSIIKRGFFWNFCASMITAFSSVGVLLIVTRCLGENEGALFSAAVAMVNTLMIVGNMNAIGYQISDVKEKYAFSTYRRQRICCLFVMISVFKYGVRKKACVITIYAIYKSINVLCELFQGRYQQLGRVDLGAKLNFLKVFVPDIVLCVAVIVTKNIVISIFLAIICGGVVLIVFNLKEWRTPFLSSRKETWHEVWKLTKDILPLFFSAFSATYILNAAKYAIDNNLDGRIQLIYTILILPATTVHMIAGFIYRPVLTQYANIWEEQKYRLFVKKIMLIVSIILVCALIILNIKKWLLAIIAAMYSMPILCEYDTEFGILLIAGTTNALNVFVCYMITIIRKQKILYYVNIVTLVSSFVIPEMYVRYAGLRGATLSYVILMGMQLAGYGFSLVITISKQMKYTIKK